MVVVEKCGGEWKQILKVGGVFSESPTALRDFGGTDFDFTTSRLHDF